MIYIVFKGRPVLKCVSIVYSRLSQYITIGSSWVVKLCSISVSAAHQQILGELLPLDPAASAGLHRESRVQEARQDLHRVQLAIPVQWEPNHLATVQLVPRGTAAGIQYGLGRLRKQLVDQRAIGAQHDSFAQIWRDVQRHHLVHFDVGGRGRILGLIM